MKMEITLPRPTLDARIETIIDALPLLYRHERRLMDTLQESSEEQDEAENAEDPKTGIGVNSVMSDTLHCLCV